MALQNYSGHQLQIPVFTQLAMATLRDNTKSFVHQKALSDVSIFPGGEY